MPVCFTGAPAAKQAKAQPVQHASPVASAASQAPAAAAAAAAPYYGQPGYNYSGYYPSYPPAQQYPAAYPADPGYP